MTISPPERDARISMLVTDFFDSIYGSLDAFSNALVIPEGSSIEVTPIILLTTFYRFFVDKIYPLHSGVSCRFTNF